MDTVVDVPHNTTIIMLNGFGVDIAPCGQLIIADLAKAEGGYVHHSAVPVALTAFAQVSPMIARGRFPKMRLVDLVAKRPVMDVSEAQALASVCGIKVDVVELSMARELARDFIAQLLHVIEHYEMGAFFGRDERAACNGIDVRPLGVNWRTDQVDEPAMRAWRQAYKALPPARQMMVATVLWLYRGGPDKTWLQRVPCTWHAADAIDSLKQAGALRDWAKLVALYPGW